MYFYLLKITAKWSTHWGWRIKAKKYYPNILSRVLIFDNVFRYCFPKTYEKFYKIGSFHIKRYKAHDIIQDLSGVRNFIFRNSSFQLKSPKQTARAGCGCVPHVDVNLLTLLLALVLVVICIAPTYRYLYPVHSILCSQIFVWNNKGYSVSRLGLLCCYVTCFDLLFLSETQAGWRNTHSLNVNGAKTYLPIPHENFPLDYTPVKSYTWNIPNYYSSIAARAMWPALSPCGTPIADIITVAW